MRILVTGGLGFIGVNLTMSLSKHGGHQIRILDNLSPQIHGVIPAVDSRVTSLSNVEVIRGDVCDREALAASLIGVDAIVHLAAETGTAQSMYRIAHYNSVNSQATALILDYLANNSHQVKKVVLASSRSIYGEGAYSCSVHGVIYPVARTSEDLALKRWTPKCPHCGADALCIPTPESARPSPASIYAATKFAQEDLVRIAGESLGIATTILRFQNVYGAGQSLNNPYTGILSIFSTRIRRGMSLPIFEDGLESRDFVHVSDVVQAISLSLENDNANGATFNVGAGVPTTVLDVANMLVDALGGNVRPEVTGQYRLGDIRHCYADLSKVKSALNFSPKVSLQSGIDEFVKWVLTQPLPEDRLDRANAELIERKLMS